MVAGCPKSHNAKSGQGHILDMVSIRERPAEIEDRAVPGHWEGDLLTGANDTHIATLVERNTRFTMLVKIPRKDTTTVVAALAKHIGKLPEELRRSLTWDQGKEMHGHKRFTVATNVQVYFCDPRSPWQRGSNENTNGLLRQYFPRGTNFSRVSQSYLNTIALRLNQRPRRPWASKRQPIDCKRCCTDRLNAQGNSGRRKLLHDYSRSIAATRPFSTASASLPCLSASAFSPNNSRRQPISAGTSASSLAAMRSRSSTVAITLAAT